MYIRFIFRSHRKCIKCFAKESAELGATRHPEGSCAHIIIYTFLVKTRTYDERESVCVSEDGLLSGPGGGWRWVGGSWHIYIYPKHARRKFRHALRCMIDENWRSVLMTSNKLLFKPFALIGKPLCGEGGRYYESWCEVEWSNGVCGCVYNIIYGHIYTSRIAASRLVCRRDSMKQYFFTLFIYTKRTHFRTRPSTPPLSVAHVIIYQSKPTAHDAPWWAPAEGLVKNIRRFIRR